MSLRSLLWLLISFWLLASGCAQHKAMAPGMDHDGDDYYGRGEMLAESASRSAPMRSAAMAPAMDMDDLRGPAAPPPAEPEEAAPAAPTDRKVHYSGFARLRVQKIEETVDLVSARAKEAGGFVENIGPDHITIRVPVASFQTFFKDLLGLGDVLERSISAADVTEAFTATDLRKKAAVQTRARLQALLARSEDEQEKLELLRQISRITTEIDQMEAQLRTLGSLADLSRITLQLVPREALAWQGAQDETDELRWIRQLSPFRRDVSETGARLKLPVPEGLVDLKVRHRFIAESADGAVIWTSTHRNRPRGQTDFWVASVKERLGPEFASVESEEVGDFTVLRFLDRGDEPYEYWVALRARGAKLDLVEVHLPSPAQRERYAAAMRAAIEGGAR